MDAISILWQPPHALPEHTRWELGFYDVALMHEAAFGSQSPNCLVGASPGSTFSRLNRKYGWSQQPVVESWWPTPPSCGILEIGSFRTGGSASVRSLRVVIVETHHADFQEIRSLIHFVAQQLWRVPADIGSYLLNLAGGDFSLSWGEDGPAATRNPEYFKRLRHIKSLEEGSTWIQGWLDQDEGLRKADVVVDCNPVWVCVVLQRLAPWLPIVVRINMSFLRYFMSWNDLDTFWSWVRDFMESPVTAVATKNRLIAEQIYRQTGARPEYVPMIMLHTRPATYTKDSSLSRAALVFKCSHPAHKQFRGLLREAAATKETEVTDSIRLDFHKDVLEKRGPLSYADMAAYRMVVLVPHVPNSCSFGDVYAMSIPILIPAEPYIYNWMWAFSNPFAGPGGDPRQRSVAPEELWPRSPSGWQRDSYQHHEDVFAHLREQIPKDQVVARVYWYQFSDYAFLPGLQRFRSAAHLLEILYRLGEADLQELSGIMRKAHKQRVYEVTRWMSCTLDALLQRRPESRPQKKHVA
eukprot:TRINITY_DN13999_c0_g1_i4.p1 TRINITY_DN13999_c0_g1~~TRINITY_DN13999_c0_g1_i4.p1  ORF type:complete len:606 (+),score=67.57 TRINITY_DN13999_c0_g1_i4:247-1818(+)